MEGITPETEEEIQNLPVGSALVCGMVDRPLVVNIRTRKSKHGGHAVDILGSAEKSEKKYNVEMKENNLTENGEYAKDVFVETQKFAEEKSIAGYKLTFH
ncbi:MAG: hypothetical protein AABY26_04440, partial [Nanoarchaeota archaeon]